MRVWAVVDDAMRLLRELGWCQRAYARDLWGAKVDEFASTVKQLCLLGALRRAAGNEAEVPASFQLAVWECYEQARIEGLKPSLVAWHDAGDRTADEVLAFLGRVLLRVRQAEMA